MPRSGNSCGGIKRECPGEVVEAPVRVGASVKYWSRSVSAPRGDGR